MTRNMQIARVVRRALVLSAMTVAGAHSPLQAQSQAVAEQEPATLQTVTVTGSRIVSPNVTSISPVTAVSGQDIVNSGRVRIEDFLNTLPSVFGSENSGVSNGSTGASLVNLRNLDSKRTLVLVNGRRLGPGDPSSGFVRNTFGADVNLIPTDLIERVDILTGGASSVYGADAVSGVVNFVMNTHFEGIRVTGTYGFYDHHNGNAIQSVLNSNTPPIAEPDSDVHTGFTKDLSIIAGLNTPDDKGNATLYFTYRNIAAIQQSKYDFSSCTLNSGDAFSCGGSSTAGPPNSGGRFQYIPDPRTGAGALNQTIGPDGHLITYPSTAAWATANSYNFGPLNYYQRPDERYTAGTFAHYKFNEHADAYGEIMFMRDDTTSQIAPSGAFFGGYPFDPNNNGALTVNCDNPFLSAEELGSWCGGSTAGNTQLYIGRRNVEGGPRQNQITHTDYRLTVGSRGDINGAWKYDISAQHGQVERSSIFLNDVSWSNVQNSLLVSNVNGVPTCHSVATGADPRCAPWNIFAPGGVTPAATAYLNTPLLQKGTVTERVVNGNVTGDLGTYNVKLPTANDGLIVNLGVEYRQEKSDFEPDASFINNLGAGQGGPTLPVVGGYSVREGFIEARMPLMQDQPFAQDLTAESGYRYSDYSLGFKTNTYKLGLQWAPVKDLRFRGSFQRAVRVPNVGELFAPKQSALDGNTDPCAGAAPALTFAQCARTGVLPGQYGHIDGNPASQYNGFVGGDPTLKPETAITKSVGFTLQPSFAHLDGLRLTMDYFDITISNAIQNPNADFTLLLCAQSGDPNLCGRIHRANDGSLWKVQTSFVTDLLTNIGQLHTRGFDVDSEYRLDMGAGGRLNFNFTGTFTQKYAVNTQPGASYECAGFYGAVCGAPLPKWRHTLRTGWSTPIKGLDVSLAWRFIDSVDVDAFGPGLGFLAGAYGTAGTGADSAKAPATDQRLSSRSYLDATASYRLDRYSFRVGVNNLLDKDPPINGASACPTGPCNGNTWPVIYDTTGRFLFVMVTADF